MYNSYDCLAFRFLNKNKSSKLFWTSNNKEVNIQFYFSFSTYFYSSFLLFISFYSTKHNLNFGSESWEEEHKHIYSRK